MSFGVGVVIQSENDAVKVGQHLYGLQRPSLFYLSTFASHGLLLDFAEYAVYNDASQFRVLPEDTGLPWSVYVGVAGLPGKTAYFAWKASSWKQSTLTLSDTVARCRSTLMPRMFVFGVEKLCSY
jgi:NADPH-dependent curcumin reductase CurA